MKLPDVRDFDLTGKTVLLRTDYDVPLQKTQNSKLPGLAKRSGAGKTQNWEVADETRIRDSLETINLLLAKGAKIIILSHIGRPEGKIVHELSLSPVAEKLGELLPGINVKFQIPNDKFSRKAGSRSAGQVGDNEITLLENLRFNPGEEKNSPEFTQKLASFGDFYVNNAFACSHREHASIVGLPKLLPHAAGLDLLEEVNVLSNVRVSPKRPVVVILGGAKEDKLGAINDFLGWADKILIGGKLPSLITNSQFPITNNQNVVVADLGQEGKDITLETIEKFTEIIKSAGIIIWSGPMGEYEIKDWEHGTRMIAQAVVESSGLKIIGGVDTEAALTKLGLEKKIDFIVKQQTLFISSGGGAMLEFLAHGTLPGIKALVE